MKLNEDQRSRIMEFVEAFTFDELADALTEIHCEDCPIFKDCWLTFENSCDNIIKHYIITGKIVGRRKEEF